MIDLHTHILPGVDDGVNTAEEAIDFARMAHEDGTRTLVATPHCKEGFFVNTRDDVLAAVETLRARFEAERIPVRLVPGAEVHLAPDLVERVKDGRAPTLADNGKTLLLELSLSQPPVELPELVFQLKLAGLVVLFAHPERIRYFHDDPARYEAVVRQGAVGQLTAGSLTGRFGERIQRYSESLLRDGLVHVLASDAHNTRGRPPTMSEGLRRAAELAGERYARAMVESAPAALLEGRSPELPPVESGRRRSFFGRWFGASGR